MISVLGIHDFWLFVVSAVLLNISPAGTGFGLRRGARCAIGLAQLDQPRAGRAVCLLRHTHRDASGAVNSTVGGEFFKPGFSGSC
ncbi:MAG: hypothetical protein KGL35_20700 [Bradyrhizobium sp.]|nr:hypothetical protein [Bradyrhizobium sp.]